MALLSFLILGSLILLGIPIAFVLGITGFMGLGLEAGWQIALSQLKTICFSVTNDYILSVIPMFVLMGNFAASGGLSADIFDCAKKWLGRTSGGVAIATCLSCSAFGAVTGSTMASASLFTNVAMPEMLKLGYDKRLASGCIVSAGSLACLIPPSLLIIFYALIVGAPIGKLLIGGIVPGVLSALLYSAGIYLLCRKFTSLSGLSVEKAGFKERIRSIKGLWIIFLIFLVVIGGIYFGWFTPTEAGAVGALSTFLVGIINRKLDFKSFKNAVVSAGVLSCAIGIIIVFGNLFSFYLTIDGFVESVPAFVSSLEVPDVLVLISLLVMYLFLGCLIDPPSMIIVTMPIVYPIAERLNYDPIWFGIIIVMMCEIAVKTPPLGMNLYAVKLAAGDELDMMSIIKGTLFFICIDIIVICLLILFPKLVTFLPNLIT